MTTKSLMLHQAQIYVGFIVEADTGIIESLFGILVFGYAIIVAMRPVLAVIPDICRAVQLAWLDVEAVGKIGVILWKAVVFAL